MAPMCFRLPATCRDGIAIDRRHFIACLALGASLVAHGAPSLTLVSVDAGGQPGSADSGWVFSTADPYRRAPVTDAGTVHFITAAALVAADVDGIADVYRYAAPGTITRVDAGDPIAPGDCFLLAAARTGATLYLARRQLLPDEFLVSVHDGDEVYVLDFRAELRQLSISADGTVGYYLQRTGVRTDLFAEPLDGSGDGPEHLVTGAAAGIDEVAAGEDGSALAVVTRAGLVAADTNGLADAYAVDRGTGAATLVSDRGTSGNIGDAPVRDVAMAGDAIAFVSSDPEFVSSDTNTADDIFVRDPSGDLARVRPLRTEPDAASQRPQLSRDGRFMVLRSRATNLVYGLVTNDRYQIYLFDRHARHYQCLSAIDGVGADADCYVPAISASGQYVTFVSAATNLEPRANGLRQVYRVDRGNDFANAAPLAQPGFYAGPAGGDLLVPLQATDADDDPLQFELLAVTGSGALHTAGGGALTSGMTVTAASLPWRLVGAEAGDTATFLYRADDGRLRSEPATVELVVFAAAAGYRRAVSTTAAGQQTVGDAYPLGNPGLDLAANGRRAVFAADNAGLGTRDLAGGFADVFCKDPVSGELRLLSTGFAARTYCAYCRISADGTAVVYYAQDGGQVIWQSLDSGARRVLASGVAAPGDRLAALRGDGRRVAWTDGQTIRLADAPFALSRGVADGTQPELSADGRLLAFREDGGVRLHNLQTGETVTVVAVGQQPRLSQTGRCVIWLDGELTLHRLDRQTGTTRAIAAAAAQPAIAANGRFVYYTATGNTDVRQAWRFDAVTNLSLRLSRTAAGTDNEGNGDCLAGALSSDGRLAAFATDASDTFADDNSGRDIILADFGPVTNTPPGLAVTLATGTEDTPLAITPAIVDAEGDDVAVAVAAGPAHGRLSRAAPALAESARATFTYVPDADFAGDDSLLLRLDDGGATVTVELSLHIVSVDDPPVVRIPRPLVQFSGSATGTLAVGDIHISDVDSELPDAAQILLRLETVASLGLLQDRDGAAVGTTAVPLTQLPLTFTPVQSQVYGSETLAVEVTVAGVTTVTNLLLVSSAARHDLQLDAGWNLVSLSLQPAIADADSWLAAYLPTVRGAVWGWSSATGRLERLTQLSAGTGLWLYAPAPAQADGIAGVAAAGPVVANGWQLVGPTLAGVPAAVAGDVLWTWRPRVGFARTSAMAMGRGYWLWRR